ncbi:MoaD/ThiS family protein [Parvularcula oceani]|uniref:MoaD/ThiS family protein n=1 Tax=Parvularcula oceani TaxID=1247963 RepID=UPI0004E0BEDB|nr:MoaD/ThiS family protein [Parvularcula oceani]
MTRILFFGRLSDLAEAEDVSLPADVTDTEALRGWLSARDARLGEALARPGIKVALNQAILPAPAPVGPGDEVAFLSPLSGG